MRRLHSSASHLLLRYCLPFALIGRVNIPHCRVNVRVSEDGLNVLWMRSTVRGHCTETASQIMKAETSAAHAGLNPLKVASSIPPYPDIASDIRGQACFNPLKVASSIPPRVE